MALTVEMTDSMSDRFRSSENGYFIGSKTNALSGLLLSRHRYPLICLDIGAGFTCFILGTILSPFESWATISSPLVIAGIVFSLIQTMLGLGMGGYERSLRFRWRIFLGVILVSTIGAVVGSLSSTYLLFYKPLGRLTFFYGGFVAFAGIASIRLLLAYVLKNNPFRFTIISDSNSAKELQKFACLKAKDSQYYDYVDWKTELFPSGNIQSFEPLAKMKVANIVVSRQALHNEKTVDMAVRALQAGYKVIDEVDFYCQVFERFPISEMSTNALLDKGISHPRVLSLFYKRVLDIVISVTVLIACAPLFLIIALAIKISSPGPVFFVQQRLGQYCKPFSIFKFRTMRINMTSDSETNFTKAGDRRVTAIGRLLRKFHLDELPQLVNILSGKMSVVGVRPEEVAFAERMKQQISLYELRYLHPPGLTGHAQIHQGYAMDTLEDTQVKLSYDLYYLCNFDLLLDLRIMLRTFFVLAKGSR